MLQIASEPSRVPIVKMLNGAVAAVSYSASAAAIFIGCCSTMTWACDDRR